MPPKPASPAHPAAVQALPIREALDRSDPLARLVERVRDSQARFEAVSALLPPPLRAALRPGPVDDQGWSLLAANAAVAAKARHLLPRLSEALVAAGWPELPIRVKVGV